MDHHTTTVEAAARVARDETDHGHDRPDPSEYQDHGRRRPRTECVGCDQPLNHDLPGMDPDSAVIGIGGWWHRHCRDTERDQRHRELQAVTQRPHAA